MPTPVIAAAGVLLGVLGFQQLSVLPDARWLLPLLPLLWWGRRFPVSLFPVALVAGFTWGHASALLHAPQEIPPVFLKDVMIAEGVVLGLPDANAQRTRFFFLADRLETWSERLEGRWKLRLSWYREAPELHPGECWRLPLRLKQAHGYRSPGAFDYEGWLYARGVRYTGYIRGDEAIRLGEAGWSMALLRQELGKLIDRAGTSVASAAVIKALVTGDRSGLSREQKQLFSLTGTSHLMAISGLHIGLVSGLVYFLFRGLWRLLPGVCARWPAPVVAVFPAVLAGLAYSALAGFSIPARRALIMLGLVFLGVLYRRQVSGPVVLAMALMLVLFLDPLAVIAAGFWLSFAAVAAIFWAARPGQRFSWLWLQFGIAVVLAPVLLWQQLPVSPVGPLVNLLVIPLFSFLIVPLALGAVLLCLVLPDTGLMLLKVLGGLVDGVLAFMKKVAAHVPDWPSLPLPVEAVIVLMLFSALLAGRAWRWRPAWTVPAVLPGILAAVVWLQRMPAPEHGNFFFALLDVGQGLSAVVRTARHLLVFDTGPSYPSGFNTGEAVLLPWLRRQGVERVDVLMLSHGDMDHVGGTTSLLRGFPVSAILSGEPLSLAGRAVSRCHAGQLWWWDGVRFEVLYPPAGINLEGNNASCVLRVSSKGQSVLLMGDLEAEGEKWLLRHMPGRLASSLVVAGHHGSNSSSTPAFIRAVQASQVLYSAGRDNRWGFPRPEVVARWRTAGAREASTADKGTLVAVLGGNAHASIFVRIAQRRRYWHR